MASETTETVKMRCGHTQTVTIALDTREERVAMAKRIAGGECSACAQRRVETVDARTGRCCDCGNYPVLTWKHHGGGFKCDDCY